MTYILKILRWTYFKSSCSLIILRAKYMFKVLLEGETWSHTFQNVGGVRFSVTCRQIFGIF